ncbi:MAG: FAD-dependent oxidoreductase [Chitinophagales bacterium]
MKNSSVYDVCIVGAGIAGATLATYLGRHGVKVAVVEKSMAERDVIIGELLQPGGVLKLKELGLQESLEGIDAQPVLGYGLFMNGENFRISYPLEDGQAITGRGFRNGKFLQRLRQLMLSAPNVTLYEGTVTDLIEGEERIKGVRYTAKEDKEEHVVDARLTVVCDGMFSVFRERLSENKKKVSSYFLGLILKDAALPYPGHGHVIVAKPSPCLVYPINSTETRMLIDFPWHEAPRKSPELTDYVLNIIGPQLPEELLPSFHAAVTEAKFKVMPNHLIPATPVFKHGAVLLGDSLNMRHPLTGGGMTAAFTDVQNLANRLVGIEDFAIEEQLTEAIQGFYATRHRQNATINILADALYGVMSNDDLKEACYSYLKLGGAYAQEPIAILSAVSRDRNLLLRHFFSVALHGAKNIVTGNTQMAAENFTPRQGISSRIRRSYAMMGKAVEIVSPLVMNERPGWVIKTALQIGKNVF